VRAHEIFSKHRLGSPPVALVKSANRRLENRILTDLDHCLDYEIGMLTTVIVGSSQTFIFEGHMVTPRGYANKYTWGGEALPGQTPGLSLVIDEPASLDAEEP
jgi:precorrin-3B C17-methyltransferase